MKSIVINEIIDLLKQTNDGNVSFVYKSLQKIRNEISKKVEE